MAIRPETCHEPGERVVLEVLEEERRRLERAPLLMDLLDAVSEFVMLLNGRRQIVIAGRALLEMLHLSDGHALRGLRPGEALECVHAFSGEHGCGAAEFCSTCGVMKAIHESHGGTKAVGECSIGREDAAEAREFRVFATPFKIDGQDFTVLALSDIRHEKRRRVLERVFFHDILNLAASLRGFGDLLGEADGEQLEEYRETVRHLADRLLGEINAQKDLAAAERNELAVRFAPVTSLEILGDIVRFYRIHDPAEGERIRLDPNAPDVAFVNDRVLVGRVVCNMAKNALEASKPGETVTLGCTVSDEVRFYVHNPGFMPRHIQLEIFKPSFSTKGEDRGLGTYSMRLLAERYLRGSVRFESSLGEGTTFTASFPLSPKGLEAAVHAAGSRLFTR